MNKRGCRFDVQRIEQCYTCSNKCHRFIDWYHENKDWYNAQIEDHVNRFPDRYMKEYIMATKKRRPAAPRMVAVLDGDKLIKIMKRDDIPEAKNPEEYMGKRIIELTGKELEVIMSIRLKRDDLAELKPKATTKKRSTKK